MKTRSKVILEVAKRMGNIHDETCNVVDCNCDAETVRGRAVLNVARAKQILELIERELLDGLKEGRDIPCIQNDRTVMGCDEIPYKHPACVLAALVGRERD